MIKHEIRVELSKSNELSEIIEQSYFIDGTMGKISNKKTPLNINQSDDVYHTIFKGLDGATVKIVNEEIIDGVMRFLIEESDNNIKLIPISIYCIKENGRYLFY